MQNVAVRGLRLRKKVLQYPVRHDVDSDDDNDDDNDEDFQIEDNNCSSSEESDGTSRKGELLLPGNLLQNKTFAKLCLIFKASLPNESPSKNHEKCFNFT